jgi:hypothetical protein
MNNPENKPIILALTSPFIDQCRDDGEAGSSKIRRLERHVK